MTRKSIVLNIHDKYSLIIWITYKINLLPQNASNEPSSTIKKIHLDSVLTSALPKF